MILENNVADNHFHRVVGEESAGTDNLAVAKVKVVLARGSKFCSSMSAYSEKLDKPELSYDANYFRQGASCCCTVAGHRMSRDPQLAQDLCQSHMLPSGCERHRAAQCRHEA